MPLSIDSNLWNFRSCQISLKTGLMSFLRPDHAQLHSFVAYGAGAVIARYRELLSLAILDRLLDVRHRKTAGSP